jgi:hypothetical protein
LPEIIPKLKPKSSKLANILDGMEDSDALSQSDPGSPVGSRFNSGSPEGSQFNARSHEIGEI